MALRNSKISQRKVLWIFIFLIVIVLSIYSQVSRFEFVNLDDDIYVTENPHLKDGVTFDGVKWALTADLFFNSPNADYWQPVTFLSRMVDISLFGFNPAAHHLMNLALHLINTLFIFYIFHSMTGALWRSAALAVIFAIHPLQAEPVAWVTARKDLLSTFFLLLSTHAYLRYVKRTSVLNLLIVFIFFVLGFMSKPWVIILPVLLIILDIWPLNRISWKSLSEKKLFLIFSAGAGFIPFLGQPQALTYSHPVTVVKNVTVNYLEYIQKAFYPVNLAIQSAHPEVIFTNQIFIISSAVLLLITGFIFRFSKKFPYLLTGWLWFVIALLPMAGLLPPADRFMYVPLIGLWVMVIWGISDLSERFPKFHRINIFILTGIFFVFSTLLSRQLSSWRNNETLFRHSLTASSGNYVAHNNLGITLIEQGDLNQAAGHYSEAQKIRSDGVTNVNLGSALAKQGKNEEAMKYFEESLRLNPNYAEAHNNLGNLLMQQGSANEAMAHYLKAVQLKPDLPEAHANLGFYYANQRDDGKAISHLSEVVRLRPDHWKAHFYLGNLLMETGRIQDALDHFKAAARLNPGDALIQSGFGIALASNNQYAEAEEHLLEAVRLKPDDADVYYNLGVLSSKQNKKEQAIRYLKNAIQLRPQYAKALSALQMLESSIPEQS